MVARWRGVIENKNKNEKRVKMRRFTKLNHFYYRMAYYEWCAFRVTHERFGRNRVSK